MMAQRGVRCGMDLSDGLLGDAGKLGYASGLSAVIEMNQIPLAPALVRQFGEDAARALALAGGEDYELLVATSAAISIQRLLSHAGFPTPTIVGRLEAGPPGQVTVLDAHGQPVTPPGSSWDHFRSGGPTS